MFLRHTMKAYGRLQVDLHSFLSLAIDWTTVSVDYHPSYSLNRTPCCDQKRPNFVPIVFANQYLESYNIFEISECKLIDRQ
jgi:hypothetical protein